MNHLPTPSTDTTCDIAAGQARFWNRHPHLSAAVWFTTVPAIVAVGALVKSGAGSPFVLLALVGAIAAFVFSTLLGHYMRGSYVFSALFGASVVFLSYIVVCVVALQIAQAHPLAALTLMLALGMVIFASSCIAFPLGIFLALHLCWLRNKTSVMRLGCGKQHAVDGREVE
jgi:hypothetical protein